MQKSYNFVSCVSEVYVKEERERGFYQYWNILDISWVIMIFLQIFTYSSLYIQFNIKSFSKPYHHEISWKSAEASPMAEHAPSSTPSWTFAVCSNTYNWNMLRNACGTYRNKVVKLVQMRNKPALQFMFWNICYKAPNNQIGFSILL